MSVISSLAELFRRGAVPSIEGTFGSGGGRTTAIENLVRRLGEGVTAPQNLLNQALSRVQLAGQRGFAIESGITVAASDLPVDPTLPIGSNFRYRVRVTVGIPNPRNPIETQTLDKIIPVDSDTALTRQEIIERTLPAAAMLGATGGFTAPDLITKGLRQPQAEVTRISIVSAYRGPLA